MCLVCISYKGNYRGVEYLVDIWGYLGTQEAWRIRLRIEKALNMELTFTNPFNDDRTAERHAIRLAQWCINGFLGTPAERVSAMPSHRSFGKVVGLK